MKYLFYEDWEENCRIRKTYLEELERKFEEASESESVDTNTSERSTLRDCVRTGGDEMDRSSNSTGRYFFNSLGEDSPRVLLFVLFLFLTAPNNLFKGLFILRMIDASLNTLDPGCS